MTDPDYGRAFALWRDAAPQWQAYTHHPFVEGLRRGELPRAAFLHYLRQDYVFLIHFTRAWALVAAKADTLAEMQAASATVHALAHVEMPLHIRICAQAGITEKDLEQTEEAAANLAYTRYVLEAGYSGDLLDLLAALAPCVLGYGEIGARLAREATSDAYGDWIATYSGAEYQDACTSVARLIDGAVARRLGDNPAATPRWAHLQRRFSTATRLEVGFWGIGTDAG